MRAVVLKKIGTSDNLVLKDVNFSDDKLKDGEIVLKHTAIGINFDDISIRNGTLDFKKNIDILGFEGIGIIEKVSQGSQLHVGQRVGYAFAPIGSYCERRIIHQRHCIALPDDLSDTDAAAILRKGLVAHTMLFRCHVPRVNNVIAVTGAGSGIGQMIARWAKYSNLKVVGVIGSDNKKDAAIQAGCDIVVNYTRQKEAIDKIKEFTDNKGINCLYDGIGKSALDFNFEALSTFGVFISYGNTSGEIESIDAKLFESKSLFFSKPRFEMYKSSRNELILSAYELFEAHKKGAILTNIMKYSFSALANAHNDIEKRKVTGCVISTI